MRPIIHWLLCVLAAYVAIAFITVTINPAQWTEGWRVCMATLSLMAGVAIFMLAYLEPR